MQMRHQRSAQGSGSYGVLLTELHSVNPAVPNALWKARRKGLGKVRVQACKRKASKTLNQEMHLQVVAVVAHELGHWKLGHTICLMVAQSLIMLAQFVLFAVFRSSSHLLHSFGFETERPVIVSLMLFLMVIGPVDKVISWLFNLLSRRCASSARWEMSCSFSFPVRFLCCLKYLFYSRGAICASAC
jgi:hypothetical protein